MITEVQSLNTDNPHEHHRAELSQLQGRSNCHILFTGSPEPRHRCLKARLKAFLEINQSEPFEVLAD